MVAHRLGTGAAHQVEGVEARHGLVATGLGSTVEAAPIVEVGLAEVDPAGEDIVEQTAQHKAVGRHPLAGLAYLNANGVQQPPQSTTTQG
ncbi:MAG TPA: hypothetical protein VK054_13965, partial [Beutenbergiaceae bacterium]|nr:hypothetical protein [Beutenbergiaceae bacterium]